MATPTVTGVEVLTVSDCPHRQLALDRVRRALDRIGATQVVVTERTLE